MKKIRKLKAILFLAVIAFSVFLYSTPVFAKLRFHRSFSRRSSKKGNMNPEQLKWFALIFCTIFLIVIVLIIISSIKSSKNSAKTKKSSGSYTNSAEPKDVSEEIAAEIKNRDLYFDTSQFLIYAENTAKRIVMASRMNDTDVLRSLESAELYEKHLSDMKSGKLKTAMSDIENFSADIIKLTEYDSDGEYEKISAYMKCTIFRNAYNTLINTPCNILLTFKRPLNTVSSYFGGGVCPSCRTESSPEESRCSLCGSILNFNTNGWELIGFEEIS